MSRVLLYTSPARGHLYPMVPIVKELERRGHEVSIRTLSSQVSLMRDLGFDASPVCERIERVQLEDYRARSLVGKGRRAIETFLARAKHEIGDLREAIQTERPDALLVDCMTWGALALAHQSSVPWAEFVPYPVSLPSREAPPYGPGLRPAHGPLGRLRDRALQPISSAMFNGAALSRLNTLLARDQLPAVPPGSNIFTLAPLVLYLTAEPFEYPRSAWPSCIRMIGPCAWDPPAESPPWLDDVKRPLILISTSSEHQNDRRLVTTALEAFANEPVELVATLPASQTAGIDVPANARVEQFMSHASLLEKAACAITHGGAGITQKALAAGVPVCVVPFGRDQYEVARRVEVADAGTRLVPWRLTPSRLRAKVKEAIAKRSGALIVAKAFAEAGGASAGVDALERLMGIDGDCA